MDRSRAFETLRGLMVERDHHALAWRIWRDEEKRFAAGIRDGVSLVPEVLGSNDQDWSLVLPAMEAHQRMCGEEVERSLFSWRRSTRATLRLESKLLNMGVAEGLFDWPTALKRQAEIDQVLAAVLSLTPAEVSV